MDSKRVTGELKPYTGTNTQTILFVAPQPPPIGGATVTVQAFLKEIAKQNSVKVILVNTSPPPKQFSTMKTRLDLEKVQRFASIIKQYVRYIKQSNVVLVFASSRSDFFAIYVPALLLLARWYHKPFYLRTFGGALDLYLEKQNKLVRNYLLSILRALDGVLVQTHQLQTALIQQGCDNTYYVPGYRSAPQAVIQKRSNSEKLRLIFLSLIYRKKGVMILLDALGLIAQVNNLKVSCDFYGPILEDREEFLHRLQATPGAHYCGEVEPHAVINLIATYDVLVLPTFAPTEGHPGAIIEAMQAGVPVISTRLRAIPELITHGENGLLVPAEDSHALAEAIRQIALDSSLRTRMGEANYRRGQEFRPEVVVTQILNIIFHRKELNKDT